MKSTKTEQAKKDFLATLEYWKWASETGRRKPAWSRVGEIKHLENHCACCEYFQEFDPFDGTMEHACRGCFLYKGGSFPFGPCLGGDFANFTILSLRGDLKRAKEYAFRIYEAIREWMAAEGML